MDIKITKNGIHHPRSTYKEVKWVRHEGTCMSEERPRRDDGTFEKEVTEQAILKTFDRADEPVLTAKEIADELNTTSVTVTRHLKEMLDKDLVGRKETGARAVAWWAKVAPELSDESKERVEESRKEVEEGDTVPLEEV
jgi:predicted HTH transcriptional regulator